MKKFVILLSLFSTSLWAIPEQGYSQLWADKVLPAFQSMQAGEFTNHEGLVIRYRFSVKPAAKKSLVILPGRGEPAVKYSEIIYDLDSSELNVFIMDHQGQGESQRSLPDSHKGYVKNFQNYVDDVHQFMRSVVLPESAGADLFLLAHSMGGAISVHYLAQHPSIFKKAFLCAPMLELNTKPYAEIIAKIYSIFLLKTGKGQEYAPGKGPYVLEEDTFEINDVTHSEARFDMSKTLSRDYPQLVVGGATVQWVSSSLKATGRIQHLGPKIKTPIFMVQAGQDEYVKNKRQDRFCNKAQDCKRQLYPQAFHELLMEKDEIRDDVMKLIRGFFEI
jgi:lysophospholipase